MRGRYYVTEEIEIVHVYPLFGKEHILDGFKCWCFPEIDKECPGVVIHNVEH
jgi:hypothetical protein